MKLSPINTSIDCGLLCLTASLYSIEEIRAGHDYDRPESLKISKHASRFRTSIRVPVKEHAYLTTRFQHDCRMGIIFPI
jgi:hypothetical protein